MIERDERDGVRRYRLGQGRTVYAFPVRTFPRLVNNLYLILDDGIWTLLDVGSGNDSSVAEFHAGFDRLRGAYGVSVQPEEVDYIVITHAHIDHFGYLHQFRGRSRARILIHELDARVLSNFEERVVLASKDLRVFMQRAGLAPGARADLEALYRSSKTWFRSIGLDDRLRDGDRIINGYRVHHTPGHCPGQICLQVGAVLFTADHVLARTTPHQSPESITHFCGLEHYLDSLDRIRALEGIALALPGHEEEIADLRSRIDAIKAFHRRRLERVMEICGEPSTLWDISQGLFGELEDYHRLLGLEEAGAHVEFLFQRGELQIANLDEVIAEADPVILYRARR
jgi:glyoxylase-like metal-dependent hydrolase (beta-lactamase superfamily II)